MSGPDLPVFSLAHGPWRAEVFDPRPAPERLGARYVHGCWLRALWRDGRPLTGAPKTTWNAYDGEGLPETFERPLAWGEARDGEVFLRPGCGIMRRMPGSGWGVGPERNAIERPVAWQVLVHSQDHLVMACEDRLERDGGAIFAYRLERSLRLRDDGLDSSTRLRLQVPWSHPLCWFAHPFWAQRRGPGTALALPAGAQVQTGASGGFVRGGDGLWRAEGERGGFAQLLGVWGLRGAENAIDAHLDAGGIMRISLDRPLDHGVLWASQHACSPEHKFAREWKDGEDNSWTVSYRWI